MKHFLSLMFLAIAVAAPAAFAQKWEVGFAAGGSFLTSETITNPAGNANATRRPRFGAERLAGQQHRQRPVRR